MGRESKSERRGHAGISEHLARHRLALITGLTTHASTATILLRHFVPPNLVTCRPRTFLRKTEVHL
jgi:hypothetical protein